VRLFFQVLFSILVGGKHCPANKTLEICGYFVALTLIWRSLAGFPEILAAAGIIFFLIIPFL
jgi:hypothetical protein